MCDIPEQFQIPNSRFQIPNLAGDTHRQGRELRDGRPFYAVFFELSTIMVVLKW
jgi:hypothetical protein